MPTLERVSEDFFDTAPHVVSTEVEVGATAKEVWAVLNDHASWPDWFPGMKSVEAQPETWSTPGDTRTVTIGALTASEEAIIVEPEKDFAFAILKWQLPIARRAAERVQLFDTSRSGEQRVNLVYTGAFELTLIGRIAWRLGVIERGFVKSWGAAFENVHEAVARRRV